MESSNKKKAKMDDPQAVRSSSSRSVVDNLPAQILMEILSRLPMRTLMATRCVCKSWLFLTSDTDFAKLHSTRAPTELLLQLRNGSKFTTDLALGEFEMGNTSVLKVHFDLVFQLPSFEVGPDNDVKFVEISPSSLVTAVNSCHGFLCYRGLYNKFAVIWNPIMGQFITVPEPRRLGDGLDLIDYGFGFSPKVNKFKLLRMLRVTDPVTGLLSSKGMAEVFTFEEGAIWRKVGYCPNFYETPEMVLVEGVIHWVIPVYNSFGLVIVSFDFDCEKFGNVPLPPFVYKVVQDRVKLGVLGGCLSLTDFSYTSCIDIWVMKEYGVQDSWTKAFSIEKKSALYYKGSYRFELVEYLENGEILLRRCNGCLVAYDPTKKRFRSIGHAPSCDFKAIAYSPSLFRLEDSMMAKHVYGLDVKLRPVLKICRSLINCDRADPKEYWRLNEENFPEHLTLRERSEALSRNLKKQISEELRKEWKEQEKLVERLQQKISRIEQLKEQIKQLEKNFVQKPPLQQCSEAPLTNDDIHVPITGEEIHGRLSMTELVQTPASSSATHVTTEVPWEQMKTMVEKLGEELRKERQQQQDFKQRLQNETEHLKQQNQKLEERLQNEETKVEELKAQIQRSKQENQQMALQLVDEMRAHLAGSR